MKPEFETVLDTLSKSKKGMMTRTQLRKALMARAAECDRIDAVIDQLCGAMWIERISPEPNRSEKRLRIKPYEINALPPARERSCHHRDVLAFITAFAPVSERSMRLRFSEVSRRCRPERLDAMCRELVDWMWIERITPAMGGPDVGCYRLKRNMVNLMHARRTRDQASLLAHFNTGGNPTCRAQIQIVIDFEKLEPERALRSYARRLRIIDPSEAKRLEEKHAEAFARIDEEEARRPIQRPLSV